jgi:hypothetical protein
MNPRALSAVLTAAVVAGTAAGCNFIVGAGSYSVGDAGTSNADAEGQGDATDSGSPPPMGNIGDPCASNADCTHAGASCMTGIPWCTESCTAGGKTCGTSSAGETNFCIQNGSNQFVCFAGCTKSGDCSAFPGTTCQPVSGGTGSVCSAPSPSGFIGDPCSVPTDCNEGTCQTGILWCTTSCTVDSDCQGLDSAGQPTYCVENGNNQFICFPGCTTDADCSAFPGLTCQPINAEPGSICSQ